jgi:hypothetical protein
MSKLCRSYTVMEIKKLLEASEGRGPGVGGHAISEHGYLRDDVTDRNKSKDSAFVQSTSFKTTTSFEDSIMRGVFDDDYKPTVKKMVKPSDQALAVCNGINSAKGQQKLAELDLKPDLGTFQAVFETPLTLAHLNPVVRSAQGHNASMQKFSKIHIELFKVNGTLHIHTAYAV